MAKTVTLENIEIQSIIINNIIEHNDESGVDAHTGWGCTVTYFVLDENGNRITARDSTKYTPGTSFPDNVKLSRDSAKLIEELANTMNANMRLREELDSEE